MNFDQLVSRLQSLYDIDQQRAVDISNERLQRMCSEAKSIRALKTIGTTVAAQATYAIAADVVQVYRLQIAFTTGTVTYKGTETLDALMDLTTGATVDACGYGRWYAVQPDTDGSQVTNNLFLAPAPDEAGATITGLCAVIPAVIVYGATTALPIPLDCHEHLLAGCKAELSDEDERQDTAAKWEVVFDAGVKRLEGREKARGTGSDRHRMRMVGYDLNRA